MKEVIFHFFPSARFLGLSLKILFHKNKEIKRMLSKKMTFSLTSLITIFALAFAVPSAMGATFGTEVTYTEGDTASGRDIVVTIEFITGQTISLDDVKRQRIRVTIVKRDFTSDTYRYVDNARAPPVGSRVLLRLMGRAVPPLYK